MIKLVLVLHCHQPVGNFDHVFEMAHDKCYRPILDLLAAHPGVKTGLHVSGPLFEWFESRQTETMDLIASLVSSGQVEPLSGGFFEPLLATIPQTDARGQMSMMNDFIENRFGRRPTGFWLTERIWDPSLPSILSGTDMDYTVVDDTHFYYAGLNPDDIFGPYVTEREGRTLKLLATPMIMRYIIPFWQVDEVINHLKGWEEAGREIAVYGDDGEKFGLWPGTHEWVIEKGWLEKFFTAVESNSDWLTAVTPGEYLADTRPLGRLYVPQASYEEMTEWALPPERGRTLEEIIATLKNENRWESWRPFVRGGVWDNFLVKYDESNRMHKKMIFLSGRAKDHPAAREFVWRAQCNCAYWHGVFGGLYMGHLRRAIHENLIQAQKLLIQGDNRVSLHRLDYDMDGQEEILVEGPAVSLGVDPARGGSLFEVGYLPKSLNLSDTLTRRPEAYHHKLVEFAAGGDRPGGDVASIHDQIKVKEEGLEKFLIYDPYTRVSLLDHFTASQVGAEDLAAGRYEEIGDFINARYDVLRAEVESDGVAIDLARTGRVGAASVRLIKTVRVGLAPVIKTVYEFECMGPEPVRAMFGCEFNLTLFSDQDRARYFLAPEHGRRREAYEAGDEFEVTRFDLLNGGDRIKTSFTLSRPGIVSFFPLLTVSISEDGFEKTYQGTTLFFFQSLALEPGQKDRMNIDVELIEI